jgi:PQQ-like domain
MRRVFGVAAAVAMAVVSVGVGMHPAAARTRASATVAPDDPWTQTQGNAADSHSNLSETTLTPSMVKGMRGLRTYTSPNAENGCGSSVGSALIGGDVVTVVNGEIVRYVAQTGKVVWQTRFDNDQVTDLAVVGNEVIVGYHDCGSASDPNGGVSAFSFATGNQTWSTPALPLCGQGVCNSGTTVDRMVVADGYLVIGGNSPGSGYNVAVMKASDGSVVWKDITSTCVVSLPIVVDQQVIFTKCNPSGAPGTPRMVADALATGSRIWQDTGTWAVQRGDFSQSRGSNVLATNPAGEVVDVNPANGKVKEALSGARDVLAVDGARAYATCGSATASGGLGSICGYALASGRKLWTSAAHPDAMLAADAGGVLYLDSGSMLDAATGKSLGSAFTSTSNAVVGISVGEGRLNVVTPSTSQLYGLKGE